MADFKPISNPYIVGNPIKTKTMFYGRQDDFEFIRRKLESGVKSYIIVFCGERRSGKTSILFQILNGELGENFQPILIDMQTMAGLKNEAEFFEKVAVEIQRAVPGNAFPTRQYDFHSTEASCYKVFDQLLADLHRALPRKTILFLIDEYELIEVKIKEGTLTPNLMTYLGGVLESDRKISFIFTGSNRLEERQLEYWKILLSKSLYRNVSYLSRADTFRLITEPVKDKVTYDDQVLEIIYRLTAGQPFYTQVVCQNLVDYLNEVEKTHVNTQDLEEVLEGILENPLPQMIYYWNSLPNNRKLILSLMAEILEQPESWTTAEEIRKTSSREEFGLNLNLKTIGATLEGLYYSRMLRKQGAQYNFQMDLFRLWIKRDHSFWQVMKEISTSQTELRMEESIRESLAARSRAELAGVEVPSPTPSRSRALLWIGLLVLVVALGGAGFWWFSRWGGETSSAPAALEEGSEAVAEEGSRWRTRAQSAQAQAREALEATGQRGGALLQRARGQFEEGQRAWQAGEYEKAYRNFLEVRTLAHAAMEQREETANKKAPAREVVDVSSYRQAALAARSRALQAQAHNTAAYREGVDWINRAEEQRRAGRREEALQSYQTAQRAFQQALTEQIRAQRAEIQQLMEEITQWRRQAEAAGMAQRDPQSYHTAQQMWALAEKDLEQEQFASARRRLEEAGSLFRKGGAEEAVAAITAREARTLQRQVERVREGLPGGAEVVEQYRQAAELEAQARNDLLENNPGAAREKLLRAEQLYRKSGTLYGQNMQMLQQLMEQYRKAVEQEDLSTMRRLYVNLAPRSQQHWQNFFKVVRDLNVALRVTDIRLFDSTAEVKADLQFHYQGAEGSGHTQQWVFTFRKIEDVWKIEDIR